MKPDEFRNIIREEVSGVIQEIVPRMIDERVSKIVDEKVGASAAHYFGLMKEEFAHRFGLLNEKLDLNQEKNDRNFAELREDISHIHTILDEHSLEMVRPKKNRSFIQQSWRPS